MRLFKRASAPVWSESSMAFKTHERAHKTVISDAFSLATVTNCFISEAPASKLAASSTAAASAVCARVASCIKPSARKRSAA